jgi:hypothetical protein
MPSETLFPILWITGGFVYLGRTWWTYTHRAASAERFGILTRYLWLGLLWFTAASVTLVVMFLTDFDPMSMGWANILGLGLVCVFQLLEKPVLKAAEAWWIRNRFKFPDFSEDSTGNPPRSPGGPPDPV